MEQHVPSVLTSQQQQNQHQQQQQQLQHHQQQQQQQNQQQQQFTSQSRRSGPEQNVGRSVGGSNGQISNPGPASVNQGHLSGQPVSVNQGLLSGHASGNHGHGNGQVNILANHSQGGPGQSGHVGTSGGQGYSNVNQGHANVLSSLLALSDPQVNSHSTKECVAILCHLEVMS